METRHPDLFRNTKFEETQAWEGLLCGPALKKRWHLWGFMESPLILYEK